MVFIINDSTRVLDIQEAFTKMFPFLKLEFYRKGIHASRGIIDIKQPNISKDKTLAEISTITKESQVTVLPEMTVIELENNIKEQFGVNLQVFRKSGNVWLQTSLTDSWTLKEQNHQGELITQQVNNRKKAS